MFCGSSRKYFAGKHVAITGGSSGIGLAVAKEFYQQGASITLIARNAAKLETAVAEVTSGSSGNLRMPTISQTVQYQTADVTAPDQISNALLAAEDQQGPIDYLICNAGSATPGYFHEQDFSVFEDHIRLNYLGTVATIKGLYARMVARSSGHIVIVCSVMGLIGMVGYSAYAPSKYALKGLADCLRSELLASGVRVSIAYPPDTDTPGLQLENAVKPPETKRISGLGDVFSPEKVAKGIVQGVRRRQYTLYGPDGPLNLLADAMQGTVPRSYLSLLLATLAGCITPLIQHIYGWLMDKISIQQAGTRFAALRAPPVAS